MSATCPKAFLSPLQVGVCVTLDQKYGPRDLIQLLFNLGFCSSNSESVLYKKNAAATHGLDIGELTTYLLLHFIADNVDHNAKTLVGEDVIHMMGQVDAVLQAMLSDNNIPRVKVTLEEIKKMGQHIIIFQKDPKVVLTNIRYTNLCTFLQDSENAKLDIM